MSARKVPNTDPVRRPRTAAATEASRRNALRKQVENWILYKLPQLDDGQLQRFAGAVLDACEARGLEPWEDGPDE